MSYIQWFLCVCFVVAILDGPLPIQGSMAEEKVLSVGEELFKETLPLQSGSCIYKFRGLRPHTWYEVKISYPASTPAGFSLALLKHASDVGLKQGRKLLNTEKLIFKTDELFSFSDQGGMSVMVNVIPEGVVAIPGKQEREYVIFNIVCDELFLGIPYKAWNVVFFVLICLVLSFVLPSYLPPHLLPENGDPVILTKDS